MKHLSEILKTIDAMWDNLTILHAEPWEKSWILRQGIRDDFEVYIVEKGSCRVKIGASECNVKQGDSFLLYSMDGNEMHPSGNNGFRVGLVTFAFGNRQRDEGLKKKLISAIRLFPQTYIMHDIEENMNLIYSMNKEMLTQSEGYMFRAKVLFSQLLINIENANKHTKLKKMNKNSRALVDVIAIYLYENAESQITLDDIARIVNLNKRYMCTLYHKVTGKTIMEHLQEIRINRAQRLLVISSLSITEISIETGFSSGQYFARIFKKTTGMSASEYRRING